MKQFSEEREDFYCSVFSELKALGVKVPKLKKYKSSIPKQEKSVSSSTCKVFGVCLSDQEKVSLADFLLPKFIVTSTSYLKKYTKKEIGLFRKAGSISRQRDLRAKLEKGESIEESEPNDVASILKQWLRELPESLIPAYLHDLFIRCLNLEDDEKKISAVLFCCHLLPPDHLHTLKHLLNFLSDIAMNCDQNKMGAHNLALIMAPNIFVMGSDSIDKSSSNLVQHYTSVLELLINNAQKIGEMPPCSSLHFLEAEALKYGNDLDLSTDGLDCSPCKSKKKRRSGPVLDLFSGIRKLVGQNSTPQNPSKSGNLDDSKSTRSSVSRSASKRKADPEQLSLSPLKKPAITPGVLQKEIINCTPKNTQNIFGTEKEKTRSVHSRRKSFGLLRKKEKKRQKSSKSTPVNEPIVSINTPSPSREKLSVSFQASTEPKEESCFDKSSPLLTSSDIDRILSKASVVKKSISDCYLTVPDEEFKDVPVFSTYSSQGCLHTEENKNSPYNLRSNKLAKKPSKRKLDVSGNEMKADLELKTYAVYKENVSQNNSASICKKMLKISPVVKKEIPKNINTLSDTKIILSDQNCGNVSMNECDLKNSPNVSETSTNRRRNSQKKKNSECIKNLSLCSNFTKVEKTTTERDSSRNEVKEINTSMSEVFEPTLLSHAAFNAKNLEEKLIRKHSFNDQQSFIVKSKNYVHQVKNIDSTMISNTNSKTNKKELDSENVCKSDQKNENSVEETVLRNNQRAESISTLNKKQVKRTVRNGSIVRGRPNTVKTGLPLDLCRRYNNESVDTWRTLTSTTSVDNDLFINLVNNTGKEDHNMSITPEFQKMTLIPNEKHVNTKMSVQNCVLKTELTVDDRSIKSVSDIKSRDRIFNNSYSKMHKTRKQFSGVSRVKSFPGRERRTTRPKKLRAVNSASPKKNKRVSNDLRKKENVCIQNSPQVFTLVVVNSSPIDNKIESNDAEKENLCTRVSSPKISHVNTPDTNAKTPETWTSGRKFLDSQTTPEEIYSQRESISMILKSKPGHVQAKVHMYDTRSKSSCTSTPLKSSTSSAVLCDPQSSHTRNRTSQKKNDSVRSNKISGARCRTRYSPLPPPPKFVIPDLNSSSPKVSYPLKELTNISNTEDITLDVSQAKNSFNTPLKDESLVDSNNKPSCSIKSKRNSYSGHTPYKLPKVCRSESSPLLTRKTKKVHKSHESLSRSPSLRTILDHNSPSFSNANYLCSPVFKTRSSLSIEKLQSDQLMDEWNCEV